MIELKHLTKRYGTTLAVNDLSLKLPNGTAYGVCGATGAGKSTLLQLLAGCLPADEGEVRVNGFDMAREPRKAKACVGFLPAHAPLYDELTPLEQLSFVAEARGLSYERGQRMIRDAMELTQTESLKHRTMAGLGREARVRVALAQALIGNPDILVLDEPTAGLDRRARAAVLDLLRLLGESKTLIVGGKDPEELCALCKRLLVLKDGNLILHAPVEEIDGAELKKQLHAQKGAESTTPAAKPAPEYDGEYELIDTSRKEKD